MTLVRSLMMSSLFVVPAALAACAVQSGEDEVIYGTNAKIQPWHDPSAPAKIQPERTSGHTLTYYGGPTLPNVKVVKVEYGTGTYASYVTGTGSGTMAAFYGAVTGSAYVTWLNSNYGSGTGHAAIGAGSYAGDHPITPSAANDGATIDDTNIQAELVAQIKAGTVPAPDGSTLYMIHFPKGKKITQGGSPSCAAGGFCAYHGTLSYNGKDVYYGVLPDNSAGSGCDVGCGTSTPYNNWCSVSSHEMTEAITDPGVGLATTYASPLGWYNKTYGEIGDECNGQQTTVKGTDGATYTVQKEWSNSLNACKATFP